MRRNIVLCLVCLFSIFYFSVTNAGDAEGLAEIIGVNRYDQVLFSVEEVASYAPCAEEFKRYVLDLTTDYGRAMYSMILSAHSQKAEIRVIGRDACDIRENAESVQYVEFVVK